MQHAMEYAQKAKQENIDAWQSNKEAYDRVFEAEQHAAITDQRANTAETELRQYAKTCQAIEAERNKMKPVYDQCTKWFGLGAFVFGFKMLLRNLLVLAVVGAVLAAAIWGLSFASPFFGLAWAWIKKILSKLLSFLKPRR